MSGDSVVISSVAFPDPRNLPLVADMQYHEPYTSAGLNRKLRGILREGFYEGFLPRPGGGLNLLITSVDGEHKTGSASVNIGDDYQITIRQQKDVTLSLSAGTKFAIILKAVYTLGSDTYQVNIKSPTQAAEIYAKNFTENCVLGDGELLICTVNVPAGATEITLGMIDSAEKKVATIGIELSNDFNSNEEKKAATPKAVKDGIENHEKKTDPHSQYAMKESPTLSGVPKAPTAAAGTDTTQIANTAFVQAAILALIGGAPTTLDTLKELAEAINNDPNFSATISSALALKAPLNDPAFTGIVTVPTPPLSVSNKQVANTEYVQAAVAALVGSSPEALDTLAELAQALGDDPNFATTMLNALAGKQPLNETLTNLSGKDVAGLLQYLGLQETITKAKNAVPSTRKVNGKNLSKDIDLRASDIKSEFGDDKEKPVQSVLDEYQLRITACELHRRVENFYTLTDTCVAELLSLNSPDAFDKSIILEVNEKLTMDYTGPISGKCSIGTPEHYTLVLCTSTTLEYESARVQLNGDGSFRYNRSWPGAKSFKLVRNTNNGLVTVWEDPVCIRSYRMPVDAGDETLRVMRDRTYTYDQAVSSIALTALGHSEKERFIRGCCAIVGSGGPVGSVPFFVNRMSGQSASHYYRTGNAAWVAYALAFYLLKYPDGEEASTARDKLTQCTEWIEKFKVSDKQDVRYGLYTSGSGRYVSGVFYPDFEADWCTSEHQFDLWFLFDLMSRIGFAGYDTKATELANRIISALWVESEGRFLAGMRVSGPDDASPLDCASWGGLFMANIDEEKARRCLRYTDLFWYATHNTTGYTPYHPEYGFPNKQRGVWTEGSAGVALLARRMNEDPIATDILARLAPLRTPHGYIDSSDYPGNDDMPPWPSSCNTAWMILASSPAGFWNVNSPALPGRYYKY